MPKQPGAPREIEARSPNVEGRRRRAVRPRVDAVDHLRRLAARFGQLNGAVCACRAGMTTRTRNTLDRVAEEIGLDAVR